MRISRGPLLAKRDPRSARSSCMDETPRSTRQPSTSGIPALSKTARIEAKRAWDSTRRAAKSGASSWALASACLIPIDMPTQPDHQATKRCKIAAAFRPSPTVASQYRPPEVGARNSMASSRSTGAWRVLGDLWSSMNKVVGGRPKTHGSFPSLTGRSRVPSGIEAQCGQFIHGARNPTIIQPPLPKSIFAPGFFPNNCKQIGSSSSAI